jgi:hypothetical protein
MDQITAPTFDHNEGTLERALCINTETQAPKAFEFEQNEAINPKDEHAESDQASEGKINTIPTIRSTTPRDFHLFPKLPAELRLMIWAAALPGPRLVDVKFHFTDEGSRFGSLPMRCTSRTPPPAILGVCSESREEALKKYSLCFTMWGGEATIYFDVEVDNLFITCNEPMDLLSSLHIVGGLAIPSFQGLRHLTLALCPDMQDVDPKDIRFLVEHLQGLETFTLVPHENHDCCVAWRDVGLRELETAEEPEGYRTGFDSVMNNEALWMPGYWRKAPVLKFMGISETPSSPCFYACLE